MVFVALAAPGDLVRVRIVESRKRFARGEIVELLEPGPDRVAARCAFFGRCGGCAWQHLAYPAQLAAKAAIVADALARVGRFEDAGAVPITPSPQAFGYRSRARLVQAGDRLGYRMRRSHSVCVVDACPVLDPRLEEMLRDPQLPSAAGPREWEAAVGNEGPPRLAAVDAAGPPVTWAVAGERLRLSHGVFAQANGLLLERLVSAVLARACARPGDRVSAVELYAGAGLFTLPLSRRFDHLVAVESHPGAVRDLGENLRRAGRSNVVLRPGPVEEVLPRLEIRSPDLLLLDPPRVGVSAEALARIVELGARRVVYLSCDPATLARDLGRLRDDGYRLRGVEAFDLFPQTPHVEALATLELGSGAATRSRLRAE